MIETRVTAEQILANAVRVLTVELNQNGGVSSDGTIDNCVRHVLHALAAAQAERDAEYAVRRHVLHALSGQGLPRELPQHGHGVITDAHALYERMYAAEKERVHLAAELADLRRLHALEDWHHDSGPVLWWAFHKGTPYEEPYVGTPDDSEWPGYHTHWTTFHIPALVAQESSK